MQTLPILTGAMAQNIVNTAVITQAGLKALK